ncbi:hypothetical protein LSH36_368g00038 [Paralvinella palmiformis]|uniref:Molybdopterin synthase catalytic subunit n=1 Tax=Paralvinella palmiformis TaxID=53620 RepID=A0AAD9JEL7_9ANNE|nr:hypothetical protein LSH36_368g00038 [Paralvinella palmiformis]
MGMNRIEILSCPLNVDKAVEFVTSPTSGAISMFIGMTRNNFDGKKVIKLQYEAYTSMAEKELNKICQHIREKWTVEHICIYHRIGQVIYDIVNILEVPVTEASVVIAVSSPHRQESLEAVHYAIDSLKASVPIWKKEIYDEGDSIWKENKECHWTVTT